jgi:protein tyrosine/serine phosphatase
MRDEDEMVRPALRRGPRAFWLLFGATALLAVSGCMHLLRNVHVVVPGEVWRSAQLPASELEAVVKEYGIRSVLNLRGPRPGAEWYDAEIDMATRQGVEHIDFELWSGRDVSPAEAGALVQVMAHAPKPLLIHCWGGADRTGLASALYRYAIAHDEAREAAKELSVWYGHAPLVHPAVAAMDRSFTAFVNTSPQ